MNTVHNEPLRDLDPEPLGELTLQIPAMPINTNSDHDISGGWVVSQMDLAAETTARQVAGGRVATVSIQQLTFICPIEVGDLVSCYTNVVNIGASSIQIEVEVWVHRSSHACSRKVTEGLFVFVAIDDHRRARRIER